MKFNWEGKNYILEFERQHKDVIVGPYDEATGIGRKVKSKYPYTTVRVVEVGANGRDKTIFRTATVGCWHREAATYSRGNGFKEISRLRALNMVTKTLPKSMKKLMWNAYLNRDKKDG